MKNLDENEITEFNPIKFDWHLYLAGVCTGLLITALTLLIKTL